MVQTHTMKVAGKDIEVSFAEDIPWGEFQSVIKEAVGTGKLDFNVFSDKLVRLTVSSKEFDFLNPTNVKKLGALEMSAVVGKMLEILPLEIYLKNLGVGDGGKVDSLLDQTTS